MSNVRDGWAVRRAGLCLDTEKGRPTWGDMWKCCPQALTPQVDNSNNARCVSSNPPPEFPKSCANSTLGLWSDSDGYFCCDPGLIGFSTKEQSWKGCATQSEIDKNSTLRISQWEGRSLPSTTSAVSSETSSSTATSAPVTSSASSESTGSSTNTGAIVGGVVGGVGGALIILGLIWFLLHRRRRPSVVSKSETSEPTYFAQPRDNSNHARELYNGPTGEELPGSNRAHHELPESKTPRTNQQPPVELS